MRAPFAGAALSLVAMLSTVPGAAFAGSPWGADYFPNVPLVNQDGVVVHFYDDLIKGKTVAVNLIYTHCTGTCPLETAKMAQVQKLLGDKVGKDIFFYSISIDPERDTPERLKEYAARYHIGPGWQFFTGKTADIAQVANKLGLSGLTDGAGNRDGHQPTLMVGNEGTGQWMRNSAVDNPQFLAATISSFFGWNAGKPKNDYASLTAVPAAPSKGGYLFQTRCAACHTIGKGDALGPDLANLTKRRSREWVARFIISPTKMLAAGDPIAKELFSKFHGVQMPDHGMNQEEMDELLQYVEAANGKLQAPKARASAARTAGR